MSVATTKQPSTSTTTEHNHQAPRRGRPRLLAAAMVLVAMALTWLMMDTVRIFFLPTLPLGAANQTSDDMG